MPVGYHRNASAASRTNVRFDWLWEQFGRLTAAGKSSPVAGSPRPARDFPSRRRVEQDRVERLPRSSVDRSRSDDRVDAEASTVAVEREDQHQDEKEEIGPRSFARRAVEAEPQIDYLQRSNDTPQPHEDAQDQ